MNDLQIAELSILISLIKWLMAIVGVSIPLIVAFFVRINKNTNEIKTEVTLVNMRQENLEKGHDKLQEQHEELKKFVYSKN